MRHGPRQAPAGQLEQRHPRHLCVHLDLRRRVEAMDKGEGVGGVTATRDAAAVERLLHDLAASAPDRWRIACLRYFNPVGAHASGLIGEDPLGIPNNLFPFVSQVAVGRRERLQIFGGDWSTPDGTCVRDYIHVMDLAEGHKAALDCLLSEAPQVLTVNLGSGRGISVLEVVNAFGHACGQPIPHTIVDRRPGDAAITVADPSLALRRLGWRTERSLDDICRDGWAWQSANPAGYGQRE